MSILFQLITFNFHPNVDQFGRNSLMMLSKAFKEGNSIFLNRENCYGCDDLMAFSCHSWPRRCLKSAQDPVCFDSFVQRSLMNLLFEVSYSIFRQTECFHFTTQIHHEFVCILQESIVLHLRTMATKRSFWKHRASFKGWFNKLLILIGRFCLM